MYKVVAVFLVCSLAAAWSLHNEGCIFSIPSTESEGVCDTYDLSKLAALGPQTYHIPNGYSYLLGLCGNIPDSMIPKQCDKVNSTFDGPVAAYQYSASDCFALGSLDASLVVRTYVRIVH